MENYHFDGEGCLVQSTDRPTKEKAMIKGYNDKRVFTGIIIIGVMIGSVILATGVIYGVTQVVLSIIDLLNK